MKNSFLILSFLFFLGLNFSFAQEHQFGVIAGVGASSNYQINIHPANNLTVNCKPILSYNFNIFYTLKYKKVGITIEPGYVLKGSKFLNDHYNFNLERDYDWLAKSHYLYTPLLVNWYVGKNIYFSLGPEFAYCLSKVVIRDEIKTIYKDIDDRFLLSGSVGINYQITKNVDVALRYSHELPHNNDKFYFYQHNLHFIAKYKIVLPKKDKE